MKSSGETKSKVMRAYAQSGQYHTIVKDPWFITWYQSHALNLVMSIESSSVEQRSCESRKCSQKWHKCRTKVVLCSKAPEKESEPRLRRGLLGGSPTLTNEEEDHEFISKEYIFIGIRSLSMRTNTQGRQYNTMRRVVISTTKLSSTSASKYWSVIIMNASCSISHKSTLF